MPSNPFWDGAHWAEEMVRLTFTVAGFVILGAFVWVCYTGPVRTTSVECICSCDQDDALDDLDGITDEEMGVLFGKGEHEIHRG